MQRTVEWSDSALPLTLEAAERYCAAMARREATNFYWGFIALPRAKRMAIYALYDFARQVDDEADRPVSERDMVHLVRHRQRLNHCLVGTYCDPVMQMLGVAASRYAIPGSELAQIIDGVEMDLNRDRYHSWEELTCYCNLVASSVGRMCVRIFGFRDPKALAFADDLGCAMQLTNILRDIREDFFQFGRIYLPLDELNQFGISEKALIGSLTDTPGYRTGDLGAGWADFIHFQGARARRLFDSGRQVANLIPTSSAACVLTMAGIYRDILGQIERDPFLPLSRRTSLSGKAKIGVMVRSWLQAV